MLAPLGPSGSFSLPVPSVLPSVDDRLVPSAVSSPDEPPASSSWFKPSALPSSSSCTIRGVASSLEVPCTGL